MELVNGISMVTVQVINLQCFHVSYYVSKGNEIKNAYTCKNLGEQEAWIEDLASNTAFISSQ